MMHCANKWQQYISQLTQMRITNSPMRTKKEAHPTQAPSIPRPHRSFPVTRPSSTLRAVEFNRGPLASVYSTYPHHAPRSDGGDGTKGVHDHAQDATNVEVASRAKLAVLFFPGQRQDAD